MAFRVRGTIAAIPVECIRRLLEDGGPGPPGALIMLVHILHADVEALRCVAEPPWIPVSRPRTPHHDHGIAKAHRRVVDLAIRAPHRGAMLAESEGLREKLQGSADVLVQEIRCDPHQLPPSSAAITRAEKGR